MTCPGCDDTGWFEFRDQHNTVRATTCACRIGLLRQKADAVAFADRVPEDQWREKFCDGLPVPADEWATPAMLDRASLPPEMRGWIRATYPGQAKTERADAWIAERGHRSDVVLFGSHGTGKTGLAVVMLRGALVRGLSCRYTLASDLLREIRSAYRPDGEISEQDVLDRFARVDVLLLDELNVKTTEFAEDTFNWLIETRQRHFRPTLITTNIGGSLEQADDAVDELRGYVGPLVFDRLRERGQFWRMNGESLRPTYGSAVAR